MTTDRREFLHLMAAGAAAGILQPALLAEPGAPARTKAILFDGFTTFDHRPFAAVAEQIAPGQGAALANLWRTRQFEYSWLRTLAGQYVDFWQVTEDALRFAAESLKIDLRPSDRRRLMQGYRELQAYPEVLAALRQLKQKGIRLAFLSNLTKEMMDAGVKRNQLEGLFDHLLTTDTVQVFKPHSRAYQMGLDAFGFAREEMLFCAFGGWDAAGAKWFGYPTFWVNRLQQPVEELGVKPDGIGADLNDLVRFVQG